MMNRPARTLAMLLAVGAAPAQNTSPFQGALPNTVILDGGWQMTPQLERCVLTHQPDGHGQDLAIIGPNGQTDVLLGVELSARGAFTAPVQLTAVAQTTGSQEIGRVTFKPTSGALGTLLTAFWPADRLLPWLARADHVSFYAPGQKLVRSVTLAGSAAAVAALNQCRVGTGTAQVSPGQPSRQVALDVGWVPSFNRDGCGIARVTAHGNQLDVRYSRARGMRVVYRTLNGPRFAPGRKLLAQLSLWHSTAAGTVVDDQYETMPFEVTAADPGNDPLVFWLVPTGFVPRLRDSHWDTLAIATLEDIPSNVDDTAHTGGSANAVADLERCIRKLPK